MDYGMYRNDPSAQGYLRVDENDTGTSGVISGSYAKGFSKTDCLLLTRLPVKIYYQ